MNYYFEIQWNYETTGDLSMIKPIFGEKMLGKFMLTKCQKHFSKDCAEQNVKNATLERNQCFMNLIFLDK